MNNFLDNKIELIKDTHTYRLLADPEIEFTSVTTLIHTLFEPFDEVAIADNLCATIPKYMGMEPNELISKWHAARDHGSKVHEEIELDLKNLMLQLKKVAAHTGIKLNEISDKHAKIRLRDSK